MREEQAWTQNRAATQADVSRITIGKIEKGIHVLPRTFDRYANIFGTSLRQLLHDVERDELDDESRGVGLSYRLASTRVRQAITALLDEQTGARLAVLVLLIAPALTSDPDRVADQVRKALEQPPAADADTEKSRPLNHPMKERHRP